MRNKELIHANRIHEIWHIDFVSERYNNGRRFRILTIVDQYSRISPHLEVANSISGEGVAQVLEGLKRQGIKPQYIVLDNGPEFISQALGKWAYENGVILNHIRPGKPTENGFIESFNGKLREECLSINWFSNLTESKQIIEQWRREYNENRPHSSLGNLTPSEYVRQQQINQSNMI